MNRRVRWWWVCVGLFVISNVATCRHAWRMTHYRTVGTRTAAPDRLSAWEKLKVLITGVSIEKPRNGPVLPPYREIHFASRDGVQLAGWDAPVTGSRATCVLFHGYTTSKAATLPEASVLRELGVRTILVDFRGSGDSDGEVTTVGWREAFDVAAATDWARENSAGRPVLLFGQSMGAAAVLRAISTQGVQPAGIVLEAPYERFLTTVGHRYQEMYLPAFPFAHLLLFWGGVQHGFNPFRLNPVDYARDVTCPALVLGGKNDPWVMTNELQSIAANIPGPTRCVVFPESKHGNYCRDAPADYRRMLGLWLDSVLSRKTGSEK